MILNPFKCKKCGEELQPENLLVGTSPDGKLTRKCGFCGFEEVVEKDVEKDLKTLKDIPMEQDIVYGEDELDKINRDFNVAFNWKRALKQEAIKWVKEDIEVYKHANILKGLNAEQGRKIHNFIVQRRQFWKDRFNIEKEVLK